MAAMAAPPMDTSSMDGELGSILNDAYESVTAEPEAPAEPVEAASEPAPGGEAPTSPETTETPVPATPGGEAGSEYKLTEDGASYLVPKTELPVLNGFKQYASEVQTIFPTVTDAKTAYQDSSDLRAMLNDYAFGTEPDANGITGIDAFVKHLAGFEHAKDPAAQAQYQQAFARMAERVPNILKDINPEAYSGLVNNFVGNQIESAYDRAREFQEEATASGFPGDQRYADVMLQRAQQMEWGATGKVRGEYDQANGVYKYDFQKKAEQPANTNLSAQEQALAKREEALLDRDFKAFDKAEVDGPMWNEYYAEIDKVLAPIKDKFPETTYADMKAGINAQLVKAMESDGEWLRMNRIERNAIVASYKQLWKNNQSTAALKPRIAAYRSDLLNKARQLLPSIAKSRINPATASAVAQSQKGRSASPQPKPTTQQTPAAPANNGKRVPYNIHDDPEFNGLFKF